MRPSTIRALSRTSKAAGCTPRNGTLASSLFDFFCRSTTTYSSAETIGVSPAFSTPGALLTISICSFDRPLLSSEVAPERMTIAVPSDPAEIIVRSKPFAIDSTAANTSTTAATPMTATSDDDRRCGRFRMLSAVTAATCFSVRMADSPIRGPGRRRSSGAWP
jgi:hypothetical protein